VSQKLARAAAAATTSLDLFRPQLDAFLPWSSSYATSLTSLRLEGTLEDDTFDPSIQQLPCPNLVELELSKCAVQLCASSQHLGLLHCCTALTRLELRFVNILDGSLDGPAGAAPGAVAQLQRLQLHICKLFAGQAKAAQALREQLLPQLTCLTDLDITSYYLAGDPLFLLVLPHFSTLVRLQKLSFHAGEGLSQASTARVCYLSSLLLRRARVSHASVPQLVVQGDGQRDAS
jgi:hypothetical protein